MELNTGHQHLDQGIQEEDGRSGPEQRTESPPAQPRGTPRRSEALATSSSGQKAHQIRPKKTATKIIMGHQIPQMTNVTGASAGN